MADAPLTGPFADALARSREAYNAKFVAARHANPKLDGEAFLQHLARRVDPVVRAVAEAFAEKVDAVTAALYDLSLALFGHGLLGREASHVAVTDVWDRLFPAVPNLLAREPARLAGLLCNAAYNLAATPGAKPHRWVKAMASAARHCPDDQTLLDCGKVLAWRCGMAHYRDGALAVARGLPADVAAVALDLPAGTVGALDMVLDRMAEDPWLSPAAAVTADPPHRDPRPPPAVARLVGRAGAFRGFGGAFLRPPAVRFDGGDFVVSDGEGAWLLKADVFGSVLVRTDAAAAAPANSPNERPGPVRIGPGGVVSWEGQVATFPELAEPTSSATDGRTLAVTIGSSHHVFLLARSVGAVS